MVFVEDIQRDSSATHVDRDLDSSYKLNKHVYFKVDRPLRSVYAPSGHARRLLFTFRARPLASAEMSQLRSGLQYGHLTDGEIFDRLHDSFHVPRDFLLGMSIVDHRLLLDELMRLRGRVAQPRCLFAHIQFGMGNRLRALGSAMAFAAKTNRALVVVWERDYHFNATFHDFFVNDLITVDEIHAQWPFDTGRDDAYEHTLLYNHMRKDGPGTQSAGKHDLEDALGKNIYIKTAYVIKSTFTGSDNPKARVSPVNDMMRTLVPIASLRREVHKLEMHGLSNMIGVHIRSKSVDKEIANVDAKHEYTEHGRGIVDYWRKTTQLHVFVEEMYRLDLQNGRKLKFFIAADDVKALSELESFFPRRVYSVPRRCDDRNPECLRYALIDVMCLAQTRMILGSYWSSFSEAAVRFGGKKISLAGVDFHRVKRPQQ